MDIFLANSGAYTLTAVFGFGDGISVAYADRWLQPVANVANIAVLVVVALVASGRWPWMVPVFVGAAIVTSVLIAGMRLRDHPLLEGMGFWRRAAMGLFHSRRLATATTSSPLDQQGATQPVRSDS